jgi:archaellum biogenesis protein FlaJ (TadC family)
MPRSTKTTTRSAPSPVKCYLAHTTDFFIFNFIFIFIFIFLLYLLSVYFSGDFGIIPRVVIGEIRESYVDEEKIDRRSHSFACFLRSPSGEW